MEVYEGYILFRRNNGVILKSDYLREDHHGEVVWDRKGNTPIIFIDKNDSLNVQVQTLIHELIHLAPEYLRYGASCKKLPSDLEDEIERKTLDIYKKEPLFVWYFRRLVQEAEEEKSAVFAS